MRTKTAPVIRLKNYCPPAYTISNVALDFQLDATETVVRSTIQIHRVKGTAPGTPLELDGDELTLVSVEINGKRMHTNAFSATPDKLVLKRPPRIKSFKLEIVTKLAPVNNKKLMGLYQSSGVFCTQCEAEGFRRITYFLDRPDVLAIYTVGIEAREEDCEHLLSNGDLVKSGKLDGGRHFAIWHDPHPKPSYLFALVGGNLDALSDTFTTMNGRKVALNIYVERGKAKMATYAMDALKRSMKWDEEVYGREYDLDIFNIVAVSDFNMGAMENKGLNVFNDKYVLADPNLATDTDYAHIEAIIAHEYFHNWTGNRITCRDWFQLCLKEGLTVYRDQEFSADQRSGAVQRIQQVKTLKAGQFAEDAGPLAHNVRPNAYKEINNFYTATVYQKGAELVRMIATLLGPDLYRKGTDLYFDRHDGEAAVVEDFLRCFEDVSGRDLSQFARWYGQAGTPEVAVTEEWDSKKGSYTLEFTQSVASTPGQKSKKLVPIPIRFGLLDSSGADIEFKTRSKAVQDDLIVLERKTTRVTFTDMKGKPIPSLLRDFSAPVRLTYDESEKARIFRAMHDTNLYNRWEALDGYALQLMVKVAKTGIDKDVDAKFVDTLRSIAFDDALEPQFRASALTLPANATIAREIGKNVDPDAIHESRASMFREVGTALGADALKLVRALADKESGANPLQASGLRALKGALLPLCVAGAVRGAEKYAEDQFYRAENMTDRLATLNTLIHWHSKPQVANKALDHFYKEFQNQPLVVNQWFSLQAMIAGRAGLTRIEELIDHPQFSLENPNRVRGLLGSFAMGNLTGFHLADGSGYDFYADQIIALDRLNPQVAARLLTLMNSWRIFEPGRAAKAETALRRIKEQSGLSRDTQEIVDLSLE